MTVSYIFEILNNLKYYKFLFHKLNVKLGKVLSLITLHLFRTENLIEHNLHCFPQNGMSDVDSTDYEDDDGSTTTTTTELQRRRNVSNSYSSSSSDSDSGTDSDSSASEYDIPVEGPPK